MKNYFRKKYLDVILSKFENEKLFLLVGARQVGKTTIMNLLKEKIEDNYKCLYINFEDYFGLNFRSKKELIDFFQFEYNFNFYEKGVIFLDEIQYLQDPEAILKSIYDDKDIKTKIIATGSRFWGQKKVGSSLIGRGEIIKIYPFDFFEFLEIKGKNTDIFAHIENYNDSNYKLIEDLVKEYLTFGGYPAVIKVLTREQKITETKKIIDRFLEKDFSYFMKTSDIIDFKKVFQFVSLNIKNILKLESIGTSLGLSRYKIQQFISFLKDSYLIYEVYPYFRDKSKEFNKSPEIFFNDVGLLNYISGNYSNIGSINENFVFLEILKNTNNYNIYFYKKNTGSEIDFIIENETQEIIPVEVKSINNDIIPKIFFTFGNDYKDKINCFIKTTQSISLTRNIEDKKVFFIPNFMTGKINF